MHVVNAANGGLKIVGGVTKIYHLEGDTWRNRPINPWGSTQTSPGIETLDVMRGFCWDRVQNTENYCRMHLFIDTRDDSNVEHYEILGSELLVMKKDSSAIDRVKYPYTANLNYDVGEKGDKVKVFECYSWSPGYNDWGYAYLYFYVEKTTKPPYLVAFSLQAHNAGSEQYTQPEEFDGEKGPESVRHKIAVSQCHTPAWGELSVCYMYLWTAATKLISYTPRYEDKEIISVGKIGQVKIYVLENRGGGATHNGFPARERSEEMSISSTARFSLTFDFSYEFSATVGFDVKAVSASVTHTVHFGFSTTKEMEESTTTTVAESITWPTTCEPGFRCTFQVIEKLDTQKIPVDFVFERDGVQWKETNELIATVDYVENYADDCCLYSYASDNCGTERLPNCNELQEEVA